MKKTDGHEDDIIREEEALLGAVQAALRAAERSEATDLAPIHTRLRGLRDEAATATVSDLPALLDQLHTHQALAGRSFGRALPDSRSPYFAHMRLRENGQIRDVLLGHCTFIDPAQAVTIIDWRHAPVSRIFYHYREGDEYEEPMPGRVAAGVMETRRVVTIQDGRLLRISTAERSLSRDNGSGWISEHARFVPDLRGGQGAATRGRVIGTGQSGRMLSEVAALLDREQFALLDADEDDSLLVLGGAGCGKTTVALHRVAALAYRDKRRFHPKKMLVVVPEKGLAILSRKLLAGLGLGAVVVTTFDDWIRRQARTLCRDLPKPACDATPSRVSRFKRHPAVLSALDDLVRRREAEIAERLRRRLPEAEAVADQFARARGPNPMTKILQVEKLWAASGEDDPYDARREILAGAVREELEREKERLESLAFDRVELFSDRAVLEAIAGASGGELTPGMVDEVLAHSRDQFGETAETRYADIDAHRLATVDGKAIDEDTPDDKAGTIDVEDYAVLLELLRRKVGRVSTSAGKLALYAHMVVDEAQDMAPVELAVLGQALRPDASVTIAGDAAQQIDPASCFDSWAKVLGIMGMGAGAQMHFLKTTYRSARPVAEYAHAILGPLAPRDAPVAVREGAPVERSDFPNEGHAAVFLTEALADLMDREPAASVAVIARNAAAARRFFETLRIVPRTRLVLAGEFPFTPGVDVTDVFQVKGLEWDYVVIPDAHVNAYPDNPESRRILHVAATRAIHQLWVVTVGKAAPILPVAAD